MSQGIRVLIAGLAGPSDVGTHLLHAATGSGIDVHLVDYQPAFAGSSIARGVSWRFLGRRPPRLGRFQEEILDACAHRRPTHIIATGTAPLTAASLNRLGAIDIKRIIFLTDDPFSQSHRSRWFLDALSAYDRVFTTRRANIEDLTRAGARSVAFLPFAYAPNVHFPETSRDGDGPDVVFVGGADRDRVSFMGALIVAGLDVALYGQYWNRFRETRDSARGYLPPARARQAVAEAKICPCLVRHSNRDGSSMRSFEVPAMSGCALMEDTEEHRELFGEEWEAVAYFSSPQGLVEKTMLLLNEPAERERLARNAHECIVGGGHTYADRLKVMLE